MNRAKEYKKIFKKSRRSKAGSEVSRSRLDIALPQRVFLYLHPKVITYPSDDMVFLRPEIEIEHQFNTITTLSDRYVSSNIIILDQFDIYKPTFSVTIEQDSLDDLTRLADCPIVLTLYAYTKSYSKASGTEEQLFEEELRTPVAQGHIDIIEYFYNKRINGTETVFLYPLKSHVQHLTCKTVWEIYSLHPLLKNLSISNYIFLTFDSLYNVDESLLDNYQNLMVNFSLIPIAANEPYPNKIFICNFKTFTKNIIAEQNLSRMWETLKSSKIENLNCMGITSECKIILNQLFSNLCCTENVKFDFNGINKNEDYNLTCNSMHRYALTGNMQKILENIISENLYQLLIEICTEADENQVLLQGYVDLSIFMYPKINNCSFAIALKPPGHKLKDEIASKRTSKTGKSKRKSRLSNQQQQNTEENKIPFALIQICLHSSITNPCQEINALSHQKPKNNKFCQYPTLLPKTQQFSFRSNCSYNYKAFDDLVFEILDYIVNNNIKIINDDEEFFCLQLSNMKNKIMKLLACDFNIRTPTKTNIEFTNLITTVYGELIERIYNIVNKCSVKSLKNCVFTDTVFQNFIVKNMSLAKYLYEVENVEIANVFMELLRTEYCNNTMLKFYIFLYDVERQRFDEVRDYLKSSLDDKDTEGELFAGLIKIYMDYKLQLQDAELKKSAEGELIEALSDYAENQNPTPLTGFVLLYCVYKRHDYRPGMAYCHWRYENLFDSLFVKLEFIPKSRWDIYMPHKINLESTRGQNFTKVCYNLLRLGLYNFAQWVFAEIADECLEIERYFFSTTFMILDHSLQENKQIKNFSIDKHENSMHLNATLSLVNGNSEYFHASTSPEYIRHYKNIVELQDQETHGYYQLGLLRYAYQRMLEQNYEEASYVFLNLCKDEIVNIVAEIGRATACYYLGQLDEAEKYFALSTEHNVYMENIWAFLALINLKKGKNYNALECWKYARLNQNSTISKDILNELSKINYSDVDLFVDVPNKI